MPQELYASGICTHHAVCFWRNQTLSRTLFPTFKWQAVGQTLHCDAVFNGTNQRAEIAANTMVFIHARDTFEWSNRAHPPHTPRVEFRNRRRRDDSCCLRLDHCRSTHRVRRRRRSVQMNTLMRTIPACRIAKLTTYAEILVNPRNNLIVKIELLPLLNIGKRQPAKIFNRSKTLLSHPRKQAILHILNDAIPIMHRRSTHLHIAATKQNKLRSIAPTRYTSDTGKRESARRISLNLLHHIECNWFYCRATVAAM